MYETHWGLQKPPFVTDRTPESFYAGAAHQAALLKLRFLIDHRRGAGLLIGPSGSGKTRLLEALLPEDARDRGVARIVYPLMTPLELLCSLLSELGDRPVSAADASVDVVLKGLVHCLRAQAAAGPASVIVIDDAHTITDRQVLQSLHLLLNLQQYPGVEFTLILTGQPELLTLTRRLPQLDDRIAIPCVLTALDPAETAEYVEHRLRAAGATAPILTQAALQTIYELSGGLPRRINRLCDFALLVGYAEGLGLIDSPHIEAVATELSLGRAA